jgi:hypothetical protein
MEESGSPSNCEPPLVTKIRGSVNYFVFWMQAGSGLMAVTKCVFLQKTLRTPQGGLKFPKSTPSERALQCLIHAASNLAKLPPARYATGGAGGALGLFALQRPTALEMVQKMAVTPVLLDLAEVNVPRMRRKRSLSAH